MDGDGGSEGVGDDEGSLSGSDKDGGSDEGDGEPMDGEDAGDATADHGDDGEAMDGEEHSDARADHGGVKSRRGRSPTRCLRYIGVTGRRRPKIVLNQFNQPIGPEPDVSSLANAIGILSKNTKVISLEFTSWRQVDEESKATLWELTTNTFDVPKEAKDWVYKTACASWRSYKSRLKAKYYKEGMNVEDMLKVKYTEEIPPDQWEALVTYWCDPKTVDLSRRNRRSVQQRKNVHTAGSCSFARIVAKETKNGKEPSMAAIYIKTRTRKNGAALISDQTKADLLNLENDAEVEDYLVSKDLLRTRSRAVTLKGRAVSKRDLKRAEYEAEIKKKAEDRVDKIRAACDAKIEAINLHFSTVIHNLVEKLQSSNLQSHFADFNPFHGCPGYDAAFYDESSDDDSYHPDDEPASEDESLVVTSDEDDPDPTAAQQ